MLRLKTTYLFSMLYLFLGLSLNAGLLDQSKLPGGIIVHINCGNGQSSLALKKDNFILQGLDTDWQNVQDSRNLFLAKGTSAEMSAELFDGKKLPYATNMINIIVVTGKSALSETEILRVLCPLGEAYIGKKKIQKPWPDNMDDWKHFLNKADNNAVSQDTRVNMPRTVNWINGPKWTRSHEELSSISGAVTSGGRLYYIVDQAPNAYISFEPIWKLVARDAFNGIKLWEKDIPVWNDHMRHFRSGPAHLPRRLAATEEHLYVTLGLDAPLAKIDGKTGQVIQKYKDTEWTEEVI
ncbi:MAG: hypothetical protein HQL32_18130, partial [Planctomycetes bacterium]|nr:hypothetical protein [Planctomycetota bacterium]